jgi:hypothetical protein
MSSTSWTSYFYVNAAGSTSGTVMNVQVGATEADGESASFTSTTGTFTYNGTNSGQQSIVFSNLPPTGETSLTHRRLIMKFTYSSGTGINLDYNGGAGVADTRLDVGVVVPERSIILSLIIPLVPGIVIGYRKRKELKQYVVICNGRKK